MHPDHFPSYPSFSSFPSPAQSAPKFPNWSALQAHNKSAHPPRCQDLQCHGRTFGSGKALRKHEIKWHLKGLSNGQIELSTPELPDGQVSGGEEDEAGLFDDVDDDEDEFKRGDSE